MGKPRSRGSGEGTIYKKRSRAKGAASDLWAAELYLGRDPDGKKRIWRKYGPTRAAVAAALATAIDEHGKGKPILAGREKLATFLTRWLASRKPPVLAPNTYANYTRFIDVHIIPTLGDIKLADLTPQDVQTRLIAPLLLTHAPGSVQRYRACLATALQDALRWGAVYRNAAALAEPPKSDPADPRWLSVAEAKRLLGVIHGHPLEALYIIVLAVGLRPGEALGLRWSDINVEERSLTVLVNLQHVDNVPILRQTKTKKAKGKVPLPEFVMDALAERRRIQDALRATVPDWHETDLIFTTERGIPLRRDNLPRQWKRFLAKAQIADARFYDLRHTCASLLAAAGVPLKEIQEILRHASIRTTADLYTHLLPVENRAGADTMDDLFRQENGA